MNIIGIGTAGCRITKNFEEMPEYETFYVDVADASHEKNFLKIKRQKTHEEYEKNYKNLNLSKIKKEATIILSGSSKITGILLRFLYQLKDRKLTVLYIKPDLSTATEEEVLTEKIVFGILQQYARSNYFSRLYIFENTAVESVLPELSIANYWRDINGVISSTYHMLNVFENTEPLLSTFSSPGETSKIATLGVVAYDTLKEKLFYDLQKPRLKKYFFGISEKTLNDEKDLLQKTRSFIKEKSEERCSSCFAIFSTEYEENYVYTVHYASMIQEENIY